MSTLSHKTVKLGPPRATLPDYGALPRTKPASHWEAVAAGCRDYPGQGLAVQIDGIKSTTIASAATDIRTGKLASFREGRWGASVRKGVLYVSYLGEALADEQEPMLKAVAS